MKKIYSFVLLSLLFFACNNEQDVAVKTVEIEGATELSLLQDEEITIAPTHIATFEVEGMMCQKGCGSILRKGLYETGGVSQVEVSFDSEKPVNEIKVHFDKNRTSIEEMITVVSKLANEQYSARLISMSEETVG